MNIRSAFSSLGRAIAAALKGAAKGAVWTSRKVIDAATGTVRTVFELLTPAVPVMPAQDAAEAYLEAAAVPEPAPVSTEIKALAATFADRANPLAAAVRH